MTETQTSADPREGLGGPDPSIVSINIPLPRELHRQVKMAAASDGLTVKDAVILALRMWVTNG
jgi:hypothetical protein